MALCLRHLLITRALAKPAAWCSPTHGSPTHTHHSTLFGPTCLRCRPSSTLGKLHSQSTILSLAPTNLAMPLTTTTTTLATASHCLPTSSSPSTISEGDTPLRHLLHLQAWRSQSNLLVLMLRALYGAPCLTFALFVCAFAWPLCLCSLSEPDQVWLLERVKRGEMTVADAVGMAKSGPDKVAKFRRMELKRASDADVARQHAEAKATENAALDAKRLAAAAVIQAAVLRWATRRKIEVGWMTKSSARARVCVCVCARAHARAARVSILLPRARACVCVCVCVCPFSCQAAYPHCSHPHLTCPFTFYAFSP
jgi:hypothetical protein